MRAAHLIIRTLRVTPSLAIVRSASRVDFAWQLQQRWVEPSSTSCARLFHSSPVFSAQPAGPRVNEAIRAASVRVTDKDGKQLGVLSRAEALQLAQSQGLDLVEIAANANPPVCRIVQYSGWKYQQMKKEKEAKKLTKAKPVKEVMVRDRIDKHDFDIKMQRCMDWFKRGHAVRIYFKGSAESQEKLLAFIQNLWKDVATAASEPTEMEGSKSILYRPLVTPKPVKKPSTVTKPGASGAKAQVTPATSDRSPSTTEPPVASKPNSASTA